MPNHFKNSPWSVMSFDIGHLQPLAAGAGHLAAKLNTGMQEVT